MLIFLTFKNKWFFHHFRQFTVLKLLNTKFQFTLSKLSSLYPIHHFKFSPEKNVTISLLRNCILLSAHSTDFQRKLCGGNPREFSKCFTAHSTYFDNVFLTNFFLRRKNNRPVKWKNYQAFACVNIESCGHWSLFSISRWWWLRCVIRIS